MSTLIINEAIQIPFDEFTFTAVRSRGPGGQNVNKVNSKVQLKWNVAKSPSISALVRKRLIQRGGTSISKSGWLTLSSQTSRHQHLNREDCLEKLRVMILDASKRQKYRIATRPTRASQLRRRHLKDLTSKKKKLRRKPNIDN